MATNLSAYETTQKLATESNEPITSSPVSGDKRALDVYIRGGGSGGGGTGFTAFDFGDSVDAGRVAALLGNEAGIADFGVGATSAQTLRVVLPTDQTVIPVSDNGGSLTVDGTVTANLGTIAGVATEVTLAALNAKFNQDYGVSSGAIRTAAQIGSAAGNAVAVKALSGNPVDADFALVTMSAIHGHTTAGSGAFVDVKVTPSGALVTSVGDLSSVVGQQTMANSLPVVIASNQSAIPVTQSGTWTTGRTWTLASGTDSVAAAQSGTWNINNVSGTITLPTGAATSANQSTEITSLQLIDDVVYSPNSAISKIVAVGGQLDDAATATVTEDNIGTVRITAGRAWRTSLYNATGSTDLGANMNGFLSNISSAVTPDGSSFSTMMSVGGFTLNNPSTLSNTDGAVYPFLLNKFQSLWTAIADDTGTALDWSTVGSGYLSPILTSIQLIDDIAHAANATLSKGVPMMGQLDDTGTATVTENNVGIVRITPSRAYHSSPHTTGGTPMFDTGPHAGFVKPYDGSGIYNIAQLVATVGGVGCAAIISADPGLNFQTYTTDGQTYSVGFIAHDGVDADGPVKTGYRARTSRPASIAENDRSDMTGDRQGQLWIDSSPYLVGKATVTSGSDVAVVAAPGANLKIVVYNIWISGYAGDAVTSVSAADQEGVEFRFASGTYYYQTVWQTATGENISAKAFNLAMNPVNLKLQHGHWDGGSNEALNVHLMGIGSGSLTTTFYVTVSYRIMPT